MAQNKQKLGWIGMGRMGYPMAERLLKAGYDVSVWNRTRAKAEPLTKIGGKVVDNLSDLKDVDVLFSIVSTGKDLEQVYFGKNSVTGHGGKIPKIFVDCSTIAVEESAAIRDRLKQLGAEFVAAPVSGNAKVIKAGKLSAVVSGSEAACQDGDADAGGDRAAGRVLRGRGRARAHLQDRPQRHARRRDREPDRDHAARQQDGRPAPRLPRVHEQRRHGLDVHALQIAGAGQSRLDHDVHAGAAAQGPRSRPRARPRMGRADAGDGGGARGAAEPFRRRHAQAQSGRISAEGLRRADGDHGARLRHEARRARTRTCRRGWRANRGA